MLIDQTFTVNASREETASFFTDIEQVSRCIPGVEGVREVEPGQYEATLAVRLGPIRAAFGGSLVLDAAETPTRLKATGEGRDRATGSMAKVDFTADLSEDAPGVTTVHAVADVAIRGKLSQFGTGVMRAAAGEIVREFAQCVNATLDTPEAKDELGETDQRDSSQASTAAVVGRPDGPESRRGLLAVLWRGFVRNLAHRLRRVADRIDARLDNGGSQR